ncbi:MAG: chemotaxis protein CheD [Actinomycetota bacterium]|nr:chemotaxis protein CheD [Actinomycetota bacterium]
MIETAKYTTMISTGIGEMAATNQGEIYLVAHGLGSCIGVCLYDKTAKVGGMAHIMLPQDNGGNASVPAKFADTGISKLLEEVLGNGALKHRLEVKIAGGARMLKLQSLDGKFDIGDRNIESVKKVLGDLGLKIVAEDVGGNYGRTVTLYPDTGVVTVRAVGKEATEI